MSWKQQFSKVSKVFTAAPGGNEAVLYEAEGSPLSRGDPRIAKIPFVTRRPTLSETKRVVTLLLAVMEPEAAPIPPQPKVSHSPEAPNTKSVKYMQQDGRLVKALVQALLENPRANCLKGSHCFHERQRMASQTSREGEVLDSLI